MVLALVAALLAAHLPAAPAPAWIGELPFDGIGAATAVVGVGTLADGSVLTVTGNLYLGYEFVRTDAAGAVLGRARFWAPLYGGPLRVVIDRAGDVFVGGRGQSDRGDFWLMRFDGRTGAWRWKSPVVWNAFDGKLQRLGALALDRHGDVFVSGVAERATYDLATMKVDGRTGRVLWGPVFFDLGRDEGPSAMLVDDRDVTIVASSGAYPAWHLAGVRYRGSSGKELWRFENGQAGLAAAAALDSDGSVVVLAPRADQSGFFLTSLSTSGATRWTTPLPDTTFTGASLSLALPQTGDADHAIFVSGVTSTGAVHWAFGAQAGAMRWGPVRIDNGAYGVTPCVAPSPEGNLLVLQSVGGSQPVSAAYALRGADGGTLWGPVLFDHRHLGFQTRLATDASGDPFVVVDGADRVSAPHELTFARLSRESGAFLAGPLSIPADLPAAVPESVLVDGRGDVVALVQNGSETVSAQAVKLDGATGAPIWGPVHITNGGFDGERHLALAADGDVFWAATVWASGGPRVAYGKLRGDTGAPAWGPFEAPWPSASFLGLASVGSDLAVLARTTSTALEVLRASGDTGAVAWGPTAVPSPAGGYSPERERLAFRGGSLAVCSETTALLDAATGAVRGAPIPTDASSGCALDADGNLFRSFRVWTPVPATHLLKLSAADGAPLFDVTLPGTSLDRLAAGADGAVVAVGQDDAGRLDVRKLSGATGAALWGPVTWTDPQAVTSFGVDVALTRAGDVAVLAEVGDVTAWRALILELDGGTGAALAAPKSYGGPWAVAPRVLALRDDAPVVGLFSTVAGPEVVSWSWSGSAAGVSRPAP